MTGFCVIVVLVILVDSGLPVLWQNPVKEISKKNKLNIGFIQSCTPKGVDRSMRLKIFLTMPKLLI